MWFGVKWYMAFESPDLPLAAENACLVQMHTFIHACVSSMRAFYFIHVRRFTA